MGCPWAVPAIVHDIMIAATPAISEMRDRRNGAGFSSLLFVIFSILTGL
jgi:hypothetical protein